MFIEALLTIPKKWKQPKSPSTGYKMGYKYTIEYYSAIKYEIRSFAATWMELENIVLSEISQA
jgi:hypothetical protein